VFEQHRQRRADRVAVVPHRPLERRDRAVLVTPFQQQPAERERRLPVGGIAREELA
jgi:hypothetical protein